MTTTVEVQAFIHKQKPLWNALAIAYTLTAYVAGLALIVLPAGWLHPIGVLLLTHSLVYSAYLSHELMHSMFPVGMPLPKRDRTHEQANTFSTLISHRHGWLNLLLLNFGYHNAHHAAMKCPWHSLPQLDRALFIGTETHYVL